MTPPVSTAKKAGAPPAAETPAGLITTKQMRELHALLRDHGITGDVTVHDYIAAWLTENDEEAVESRKDLPTLVAAKMIRDLARADVTAAPGGLLRAMLAVQAALPMVQKTKTAEIEGRSSYSYTYADLADVTAAAIPLLNAHGLVFMATPRRTEGGGYELAGVLAHAPSGEREVGALPLHGNDPRQIGGALTYHRRYLLGCMLGIVTDDDVDARQAVHASRTRTWDGPSTAELLTQVEADAARAGMTFETATEAFRKNRGDIPLEDLDAIDPWVLAPMAKSLREHAEKIEADALAAANPPPVLTPAEVLARLDELSQRIPEKPSWEEFTARYRATHGDITVEDLETEPVEALMEWEAQITAWLQAQQAGQ